MVVTTIFSVTKAEFTEKVAWAEEASSRSVEELRKVSLLGQETAVEGVADDNNNNKNNDETNNKQSKCK